MGILKDNMILKFIIGVIVYASVISGQS